MSPRALKRKKLEGSSGNSDEQDKIETISYVSSTFTTTGDTQLQELPRPGSFKYLVSDPNSLMDDDDCNENDIGRFVGRAPMLSTEKKKEHGNPLLKDGPGSCKILSRKCACRFATLTNIPRALLENLKIVKSIITCIIFCGSHDLALRGKHYGEGILEDLYKLRTDAGDLILKKHIKYGKKNASYRSVDIQNEIIGVKADIMKKVKEAEAYYSVLADETADISGTEQLSIGMRYFDEETQIMF